MAESSILAPGEQPPPIEAAADDERADDDEFAPSVFDVSSKASTSITSSVYSHAYENGRRYHQYRHGRYPIPNDDMEQNRDDMKHAMMLELTDGKLFYAPIGDNPQKILDLGTGTGIWAVDVADRYPSASVVGVDLSPIQPTWVPANLKFFVDDIEDGWVNGDGWDLVHLRTVTPWLKDRDTFFRRVYENLKPGGWVELQEFDARANCDDGTMPPDAALKRFFDTADAAVKTFGMDFRAGEKIREPLEKAGFVNVSVVTHKVPLGTWPKDKRLRLIGLYARTAVNDMFGAMAAKPFRALHMAPADSDVFLAAARQDLNNPEMHSYENFFFWMGQKPEEGEEGEEQKKTKKEE